MADRQHRIRSGQQGAARHGFLDDLSQAIARLSDASERMRHRLDQVDPYEQPARWAAVNDQIRRLDERISHLRDEHQRLALAAAELRPLGADEIARLRSCTAALADLVRAMSTSTAVAEAAGKLADVAGELVQKTLPKS
ncbi:MAG TPA: hypothetical protein VIK91_17005 [Nannocystis sp.]